MIAKLQPGTVVVAWDFSEESKGELAAALELVTQPTDVRVLHVAPSESGTFAITAELDSDTPQYRELKHRFRQQLADRFANPDIPFYVVTGNTGVEIVRFANRYSAGLIVMGTRHHWPIARLIRGSITSEVIHAATCPVLIVKDRVAEPKRLPSP